MDLTNSETTTSGPLLVDATQVGDLADRLAGWYLFPTEGKIPLCPWQTYAATGREAVVSLWERFGGHNEDGTPRSTEVAVACDPSDIYVIDEDRDWRSDELSPNSAWQEWATALDSCESLVLPSSHRGRPHYYFKQPSDGQGRVAERVWFGGEIKSRGYVVLAAAPPIYQPTSAGGGLWTSADVVEAIPPLVELIGRRRDQSDRLAATHGRVTREEFVSWLEQEPGENFGGRLISEDHEASFIKKLIDRFEASVEDGNSRRTACLNTIHTAVIESYQGIYSLRAAYDAIQDAYERLRTYGPGDCSGDKGWTQKRADDFQGMWDSEVHKPDALRAAEASYDELVQRLSSAGVGVEMSEGEIEEDAMCMDIIYRASEEENTAEVEETISEPIPAQEIAEETTGNSDEEVSWDDLGDQVVPLEQSPLIPPTVSPVVLAPEAQRGVLWDLVSGLIGQHELPHVALMITLAGWAGCVLGSAGAGAMKIGEDRHGPELCVCMVGTSSVSHKSGTVSFGQMVFKEWRDPMETCVGAPGPSSGYFREVSGIESGQAFVEIWPGAADIAGGDGIGRAVIMVEKELTSMWKKAARKGSTIPEEVRKAWDGEMLAVRGVRAGNHRILPENYRFSAVGATIQSLAAQAIRESGADISGDGNRWLWVWGQEVPYPVKGHPSFDKHPLVGRVRDQVRGLINSIEKARSEGWWPGSAIGPGGVPIIEFGEPNLWWTPEADQAWLGDEGTDRAGMGIKADLRNEIGTSGKDGPVVKSLMGRNQQQVMRLALGYEMLKAGPGWAGLVKDTLRPDGQAWCISLEALEWAHAVWRYCADTIRLLFANTTGDSKIDELVSAIREIGRDMGKQFPGYVLKNDVVGQGFSKNSITALLASAEEQGVIWTGGVKREGRGSARIVVGLPEWSPPPEVIKRKTRTRG